MRDVSTAWVIFGLILIVSGLGTLWVLRSERDWSGPEPEPDVVDDDPCGDFAAWECQLTEPDEITPVPVSDEDLLDLAETLGVVGGGW